MPGRGRVGAGPVPAWARRRSAHHRDEAPNGHSRRTLYGVFTKWRRVASIRPDRLCQLSGQSGGEGLGFGGETARGDDRRGRTVVGGGQHRRMARIESPGQGDPRADPRAQRQPGPARPLRPRPDQPRRHRPPHRPDPHQRRRAGRGPRARRPGPRGRPRPEHRRQGPDPRRARRRRPPRRSPSTSASARSRPRSSTSAASSATGAPATSKAATATTPSPSSTT